MDTTQPAECAYLTLHNGNDYGNEADRSTIQRRDTLWVTSSVTTTDWHDDSTAPGSLTEFRGKNWTTAGLTRASTQPADPGSTSTTIGLYIPGPRKWRRSVNIFTPPPAGTVVNASGVGTFSGGGTLAVVQGGTQVASGTATLTGAGSLGGSGTATQSGLFSSTFKSTF
jgi:hypothetical protein